MNLGACLDIATEKPIETHAILTIASCRVHERKLTSGFAGNKLGQIRDNKGKPVAQVFATLPGSQKAQILRALAFKVLGSMGA